MNSGILVHLEKKASGKVLINSEDEPAAILPLLFSTFYDTLT